MEKNYLLVLFYSASGSVKKIAHAIADGAEDVGIKVKIRTVPKVSAKNEKVEANIPETGEVYCTKDDLINCSGLALGSPTRFGSMASSLKYFLDSTGDLWATNALEDKPGIVFTSTGSMHGGQETTLFNLITFMLHHGMIVAGSPYSISELHKTKSGGTPYGATHVESFNKSNELTKDEYEIAKKSGVRIADLIKKGFAYENKKHVYFEVKKFPDYGKLSNKNLEDLIAGSRVEISENKKNSEDFVLWKPSNNDEPAWDSPWGKGRPGWHLECSAMSKKFLGNEFDIHGGGIDLIFPHHENEIAQSRCANDTKVFANYWVHNAFITIK